MVIRASTAIPVAVGDRVEVYSSGRVLGVAALVYLGPVALFLLGYLLPAALPEGARYACGGLGFLLGLAGAAAPMRGLALSCGCDLLSRKSKSFFAVIYRLNTQRRYQS